MHIQKRFVSGCDSPSRPASAGAPRQAMDDPAVAVEEGLRPWPHIRDTWWVFVLAAAALGMFLLGLLVDPRCGRPVCRGSPARRLFDLSELGSLRRLLTTGLSVD